MTTTTTQMSVTVSDFQVKEPLNYAPFRSAARRFTNGLITRERLVFDWREAQEEQRIKAARRIVV